MKYTTEIIVELLGGHLYIYTQAGGLQTDLRAHQVTRIDTHARQLAEPLTSVEYRLGMTYAMRVGKNRSRNHSEKARPSHVSTLTCW